MNETTRPNILWICSDQQRFDTLGCYGNRFVATPNIDRLAAGGVLFENAFSQSPVCTPSRGCFLTGRYPRTCRARQNGADIPEDEVTVTRILHENGYTCGLSGKLHLSACAPSHCHGTERRIDDGYDQFSWSHHPASDWISNEYVQWLRSSGRDLVREKHPESRYVRGNVEGPWTQAAWCADKAIAFMNQATRLPSPWLFSVNTFDPHDSYDPPEDYLRRYVDMLDAIPLPNYEDGELAHKPFYQQFDHQGAYGHGAGLVYDEMTGRDHRMVRAAYWAMCDLIDAQVGRMLECLQSTGQLENTIIIYTSDHGEMLGDHGIYLKGPYFYDCAVKIPLVISWKDKIESRRIGALVELTDLPQTILDAAGMPHHPGMQGRSLMPLIAGAATEHRPDIYCEYYNAMPWHGGRYGAENCKPLGGRFREQPAFATMVRTAAWKLTVDHQRSFGELYDLSEDPLEHRNLWDDPRHAAAKTEMLVRMTNRMAFTCDPLPARSASW